MKRTLFWLSIAMMSSASVFAQKSNVSKAGNLLYQDPVEYAKAQGSHHADMLYVTYTKLANKMAGITKRDSATTAQLNDLSTMERLIANVVLDGIENGIHYKEIYQNSKNRLETVKGWLSVA